MLSLSFSVLAGIFDPVHGFVGKTEQLVSAVYVVREDHNPDAGAHRHVLTAQANRLRQRIDQFPGNVCCVSS
jgi:hypothetical protein